MTSEHQPTNPYVGPRAYNTGETLFGRDLEIRQLFELLIAERIILLHSPSGAGKTSLVQAGLLPRLINEGFKVLPIVRLYHKAPDTLRQKDGFNRYLYSLLLSIDPGIQDDEEKFSEQFIPIDLQEYLATFNNKKGETQLEVLIIDQFEEVLSIDPTDIVKKVEFFSQLAEALQNPRLWGLFIVRDDYVGALEPYTRAIPTQLANSYHLDFLSVNAAYQAIRNPAQHANVDFTDAAVSKLVEELRKIQVQEPDGSMQIRLGAYIEPVQLQVVCYRLWKQLPSKKTKITVDDVLLVGNVDQSLGEYYAETVSEVSQETKEEERTIREWFEHQLITEGGIRDQVLMGVGKSRGLDNRTISKLEDAHLIRAEKSRGATWFELTHDRLINPIREDNAAWFAENLSLLQRRAAEWEYFGRKGELLILGETLAKEVALVQAHPEKQSPIDQAYLEECLKVQQREDERRASKEQELQMAQELAETQTRAAQRFRRLAIILVVVLIGAAILGLIVVLQSRSLESITVTAQSNQTRAVQDRATAEHVGQVARVEQTRSAYSEATAQAAIEISKEREVKAKAAIKIAETESAKSRNSLYDVLASQSIALIPTQPLVSPLLAAEAITRTVQAGDPLPLRLLIAFIENQAQLGRSLLHYGPSLNYWDDTGIAFSPDSRWLATVGMPERIVNLYDLHDPDSLSSPVQLDSRMSAVKDVEITRDGHWLLACGDNFVLQWDLLVREFPPIAVTFFAASGEVNRMTLSRDGRWLFVNGEKNALLDLQIPDPGENAIPMPEEIDIAAFSPEGNWLASDVGNEIWLWDLTSHQLGAPRKQLIPHDYVNALEFSPDGSFLAIAGDEFTSVWQIDSQGTLTGPYTFGRDIYDYELGDVNDVAFSPKSDRLVTVSNDHTARYTYYFLRNLGKDETIHDSVFEVRKDSVYKTAYSPNGMFLATGGYDNLTYLYSTEQLFEDEIGRPWLLHGHNSYGVARLVFSPDERWMVTADDEGEFRLWNPFVPGAVGLPISPADGWTTSLALSADGRWLALGYENDMIRVFDLQAPDPWVATHQLETNRGSGKKLRPEITSLALSPDGGWIAASNSNEELIAWDLSHVEPREILRVPEDSRVALAFSPDMRWLAADSGVLRMFDLTLEDPEANVLDLGSIIDFSFSQHGGWLTIGSYDGAVGLWDLRNGSSQSGPLILQGLKDHVDKWIFDPQERWLAGLSSSGLVQLWNLSYPGSMEKPIVLSLVETGVPPDSLEWTEWYPFLVFSPDGRWLAAPYMAISQDSNFDILVWSTQNLASAGGEAIPADVVLPGSPEMILSLAFSPDGHWLASGNSIGYGVWGRWGTDTSSSLRIYDMTSPDPGGNYAVLKALENYHIYDVSFTQDGRWLLARQLDGVFTLPMQPVEQYRMLCQLIRANLSWEEWRKYFPGEALYRKTCPQWEIGE